MLIDFLKKKSGLAFLEIALISPIFLVLVMGIIEFSIIFSIRSGLEEISRDFARKTLAQATFVTIATQQNISYEQAVINFIHTRSTNIVLKPQNLQFCIAMRQKLSDIIIIPLTSMTQCVQFSSNRNTKSTAFFNINDKDYIVIRLSYRHQYLTPLGRLIRALGNDLTFYTITYFKKE